MLSDAILKIDTEMKGSNDPYILVVGEFLLQHLNKNPQDAVKIMKVDKTIGKSLDEMEKLTKKKKVGNRAMFTPQEGFEIVMKYFEIEGATFTKGITNCTKRTIQAQPVEPKSKINFDIKLEDLL